MRDFIFIYIAVTSFISGSLEDRDEVSQIISHNETQAYDNIKNLDIPDSALMLLDRINLRQLAAMKYTQKARARPTTTQKRKKNKIKQGQQTQKPTEKPVTEEEEEEEAATSLTPCSCSQGICKCCTGYVLDLFNQKACMKITYHPGDFAFDVAMSMNDRVLYESSISGKNPRPICISPPRINNLKVCAKFFNVFFPGRNFHFCLAMTGQWRDFELFNMGFNCLRMGANGIAMMGPEENSGLVIPNPQGGVDAVIDSGDDDIEEYDENLVKSLFDVFDRRRR